MIGFTSITVNEGAFVTFDGSRSTDPEGNALTYSWSFGDETTGTGVSVIHKYLTAGDKHGHADGRRRLRRNRAPRRPTVIVNDVPPVFVPEAYVPPPVTLHDGDSGRRVRRGDRIG